MAVVATTTSHLLSSDSLFHHLQVADAVLLRPRPLARCAGVLILLPLLPKRTPLKELPSEVWSRVLSSIVEDARGIDVTEWDPVKKAFVWKLASVCKQFKDIVHPLIYSRCMISTLTSLQKFTSHLLSAEQRWDSIRRIRYSTPGRWVTSLNLSGLNITTRTDAYMADSLLTTLFPLLPFLARLELNLTMQLSRRAMCALGMREGATHLRALKSVKYDSVLPVSTHMILGYEDPLTSLVACLDGLEELEIIGPGLDELDMVIAASTTQHDNTDVSFAASPTRLHLPRLHTLTILSTPSSDLLLHLINTPLPSLRNLIVTPYGTLAPSISHVTRFLKAHGPSIRTLVLHTPPAWPTALYPPPAGLLDMMPRLQALSLEMPPQSSENVGGNSWWTTPSTPSYPHPLRSLWIPRPTPELRAALINERLLPPYTCLEEVRARDVRWARRGMSDRAHQAGVQGEMHLWKRMLRTKGVVLVDADGRDSGL